MIKSIVRFLRWTPKVIDKLYFDDLDYHGLVYWYNDARAYEKELKTKPKGKS